MSRSTCSKFIDFLGPKASTVLFILVVRACKLLVPKSFLLFLSPAAQAREGCHPPLSSCTNPVVSPELGSEAFFPWCWQYSMSLALLDFGNSLTANVR
jgi:hypothetical protein